MALPEERKGEGRRKTDVLGVLNAVAAIVTAVAAVIAVFFR